MRKFYAFFFFAFSVCSVIAQPEMNVKQGSTTIPDGAGVYNFGSVTFPDSSSAVIFTIENLGTAGSLVLSGFPYVQISGSNASDFIVDETQLSSVIVASGSSTFEITFAPSSAGAKSATITIFSNDANESPYDFTITATANVFVTSALLVPVKNFVRPCYNHFNTKSGLSYSISNEMVGKVKINVFNSSGKMMVDMTLKDASGILPLSSNSSAKGICFFTAIYDGTVIGRDKIVIY